MFRSRVRVLAGVIVLFALLMSIGVVVAKPKDPPGRGRGAAGGRGRAAVVWTPARVTLTLDGSGAATASVTFVSSAALNNIVLRVPGRLGRVLQVSPATIARVEANVPQTITLSIAPGTATRNAAGVV